MPSKPVTSIGTGRKRSGKRGYRKSGKLLTFDSFWAKKLGISQEAVKLLSMLTTAMKPSPQKRERSAGGRYGTIMISHSNVMTTLTCSQSDSSLLVSNNTIMLGASVVLQAGTPLPTVLVSGTGSQKEPCKS